MSTSTISLNGRGIFSSTRSEATLLKYFISLIFSIRARVFKTGLIPSLLRFLVFLAMLYSVHALSKYTEGYSLLSDKELNSPIINFSTSLSKSAKPPTVGRSSGMIACSIHSWFTYVYKSS